MPEQPDLTELVPLAQLVEKIVRETPIRLGPGGTDHLAAELTVRTAVWIGKNVLPRAEGMAAFVNDVDAERQRQLAKWGDQRHADGTGGLGYVDKADAARFACQAYAEDGPRWSLILLEEVYEALAESDPAKLRTELVQAAAVIAAWVSDLDRRPHSMICAHCGDLIPTVEVGWTWSAPLCPPGTPENVAPRFHIDREACQAACDALSTVRADGQPS